MMINRNRFIEKWSYLKRFDCETATLDANVAELADCIDPRYEVVNAETTYILTNEDQSTPLFMLWNGKLYQVSEVK